MPARTLAPGQRCEIRVFDVVSGTDTCVYTTRERLLEAPNWTLAGDALILNGDDLLWRFDLAQGRLTQIAYEGLPPINNDHVLDPDGVHIFLSANGDGQIYRAPLAGGQATCVTGASSPAGMVHFLHGVSPDGRELAFVGVIVDENDPNRRFLSAEICTVASDGNGFRQLTTSGHPADGPEYSPNGAWLYFNTEAFSGHAQIARMRPDGSGAERLTHSDTVDWFPHLAPDGNRAVYLAYPPGTKGHPADKPVALHLVEGGRWEAAKPVARFTGGQGTINVNSWGPDSTRFAYVAYPSS
ncbi:hypothetical protein [Pseudoruegeria sp. SHC-113]|uniref:hypothetical protein n=1 Tax=Pseudoruegeria sp. SHC-113 TaxID=2855439 RepID=UPI0021BAE655|nr:hypothetical protein [Pseudoruegeria sp. SHC-113]MCT8160692.1 hypothetical protein [Pseudoruegeria sp. SHC-113]